MRASVLAVAGGLAVAVAGCGQTSPSLGSPSLGSSPPQRTVSARPASIPPHPCSDWTGHIGKPPAHLRWQRSRVPSGFEPVLLITCEYRDRTTPHDGMWTYVVEKRATAGLDAVVAALRSKPTPPPSGNYACTLELRVDPWFLLVDRAGHVVLPVIPRDRACDKPIDVGLSKLSYTVAGSKRETQEATAAEVGTGCPGRYKDEPRMAIDDQTSRPASSRVVVSARPVRVCTYRSPDGADPEVGVFVGGTRLSAREAARIGSLLKANAPRVGIMCPPADRFAVVFTDSYSTPFVALDGCQVMYVDEGRTWTSPVPELVKAIKALKLER